MKGRSSFLLVAWLGLAVGGVLLWRWLPRRPDPETGAIFQGTTPSLTSSSSNRLPALAPVPGAVRSPSPGDTGQRTTVTQWQDHWWGQPIRQAECAAFADWCRRYISAPDAAAKAALEAEGIQLAATRREALKQLIKADPQQALELVVPVGLRRVLPPALTELLEQGVSARGSLEVLAALPEPGKEHEVTPVFRVVRMGETTYDAYVYGRRLGQPTRFNIPLRGVALDGLMAVHESALRLLTPEEAAEVQGQAADAYCSVSGNVSTINNEQTPVELAGQVRFLCGPAHVQDLNDRLVAAEGGSTPTGGTTGEDPQGSAWTEGQKKILIIRVDFPDLTGVSLTDSGATTLISNLNNFYTEMSYGRASFALVGAGSDFTPILRMPSSASYYGTNNFYDRLRSDARSAATAAGYVLGSFNLDVICFGPVPGWGWGGLGYVGAAGSWLRNSFSTGVAGHELGHNYGLNHANFWETSGQSVIGPGSSTEYGDSFDTMGSASAGNNHFNTRYKNYLNWLTASEVVTATNSGTYRIQAHDNAAVTGVRALKVARNSTTNYWVEFRQKFTSNRWLMSGVGIRRAQNGNQRSELLDTTPGSTQAKTDSAIVIGRTFTDKNAGIHITPIRKGGTSPESVDVVVNLGTFPNNRPPTVAITASAANVATSSNVIFSAVAADADGDTLAYYWDFGDGNFGTNAPAAGKTWSTAGDYLVQCWVTDMKGGVASDSVVVRVGSPATYRISGRVTVDGYPAQGVRVYASSTRVTWSDSDGGYTLVGLPAGSYAVAASALGYTFTSAGFTNPVVVGPDVANVDWNAGATDRGVAMTAPANNATFATPANVVITATASAGLGRTISFVEFYSGGAKLGQSAVPPYSLTWSNVPVGSYTLTARATDNTGAMMTSAPVAITVTLQPPSIVSQPQSQTVSMGGSAFFSVTTLGSPPLVYQWRFNGNSLPGQTSSSLSKSNVQSSDGGGYSVVVANSAGSVTSAVATLTVLSPPSITSQPQSLSVLSGTSVSFSVTASGSGPITYQWRFNGSNLQGGSARNATYTMNNVSPSRAGGYDVLVSNGAGTVTSAVATLTINAPPSILAQPQSRTVLAGGTATFSVTAAGATPLAYQWRRDGVPLPGATASSLTLPGVQSTNAGGYTVVVSNPLGNVTSAVATLAVSGSVSNQIRLVAVVPLTNRQVEVQISGSSGDRYQIEASTNLTAWSVLGSTTNTAGTARFTDTVAAQYNRRFYRAMLLP